MENRYRKIWMIVTLGILSVAVIGLILYAVFADRRINDYKNEILAKANGAFEEVVDEVSGLGDQAPKGFGEQRCREYPEAAHGSLAGGWGRPRPALQDFPSPRRRGPS